MTDQEIVIFAGNTLVNNWKYLLTGILTTIGAGVAGAWRLSKLLHGKEVELLKLQLAHQNERFSQYESLVEKRISIIKREAELLQRKATSSERRYVDNPPIVPESNSDIVEYLDIPSFLRRSVDDDMEVREPKVEYGATDRIGKFISETDVINNILKRAIGLI